MRASECKGKGASGGKRGLVSALRLVRALLRPVAARLPLARAHPRLVGARLGAEGRGEGWRRRQWDSGRR